MINVESGRISPRHASEPGVTSLLWQTKGKGLWQPRCCAPCGPITAVSWTLSKWHPCVRLRNARMQDLASEKGLELELCKCDQEVGLKDGEGWRVGVFFNFTWEARSRLDSPGDCGKLMIKLLLKLLLNYMVKTLKEKKKSICGIVISTLLALNLKAVTHSKKPPVRNRISQ